MVRAGFADPDRLCDDLSTERYLEALGGLEQCTSDAAGAPANGRVEGEGFTLGEVTETPDGVTVIVETPDFGRYVYELVVEDGRLLIDEVELRVPGSD